jgi:hypothetical protein
VPTCSGGTGGRRSRSNGRGASGNTFVLASPFPERPIPRVSIASPIVPAMFF